MKKIIPLLLLALAIMTSSALANSMRDKAFDTLLTKAAENGSIKVIVNINMPFQPAGNLSSVAETAQKTAIAKSQNALLDSLAGLNVTEVKKFATIPFLAITASPEALNSLKSNPAVKGIEEDVLFRPFLDVSVPLIGGATAWESDYTGSGQTVAILDSGVDSSHPMLTDGKVVAEACYSSTYSQYKITTVCPNGKSSQTGTGAGVNCNTSISGCEHGTHVAGIAAGNTYTTGGVTLAGVAKEASVIAVQVFSKVNNTSLCGKYNPCVLSYTSDQILGMEYVYSLRNKYKIAAINMSIGGDTKYTSSCDSDYTSEKAAIDTLRSVGIATNIAAGNYYFKDGLSAPACISTAISVGSVNSGRGGTADKADDYSNSAKTLSLLAPGSYITSAVPGDSVESWSGTSMATPHVAGAWALMKQAKSSASVATVLSALQKTGKSVKDTNGITKPRINVDSAITSIGGAISTTNVTHTLTAPDTTSVARGGTLGPFYTELTNNGSSSATVKLQPSFTKPDGTKWTGGYTSVKLAAGASTSQAVYINIASNAATGTWTHTVTVYDSSLSSTLDTDSFTFTVTAADEPETSAAKAWFDGMKSVPGARTESTDGAEFLIFPDR